MIEPTAILAYILTAIFGVVAAITSAVILDHHGLYSASCDAECTQVGISPGMRIGFNGERILFGAKVACGIYGSSQSKGGYEYFTEVIHDVAIIFTSILLHLISAVVPTASNLADGFSYLFAAFTYFNTCGVGEFFYIRIVLENLVTSIYLVAAGATVDTVFKMGPKCVWSVLFAVFVWRYLYTGAQVQAFSQSHQPYTIGLRASDSSPTVAGKVVNSAVAPEEQHCQQEAGHENDTAELVP